MRLQCPYCDEQFVRPCWLSSSSSTLAWRRSLRETFPIRTITRNSKRLANFGDRHIVCCSSCNTDVSGIVNNTRLVCSTLLALCNDKMFAESERRGNDETHGSFFEKLWPHLHCVYEGIYSLSIDYKCRQSLQVWNVIEPDTSSLSVVSIISGTIWRFTIYDYRFPIRRCSLISWSIVVTSRGLWNFAAVLIRWRNVSNYSHLHILDPKEFNQNQRLRYIKAKDNRILFIERRKCREFRYTVRTFEIDVSDVCHRQ